MNATLVSREERVAAPHVPRATRSGVEQVEISVRQRRIVGNLTGTGHGPPQHNSHCAIPVCNVVLDRGSTEGNYQQAVETVPVKSVVIHRTQRGASAHILR